MAASPALPARPDRVALAALIASSTLLAFGPLLVRLSESAGGIGPVTSAFWRMALAAPVLAAVAVAARRRQGGAPALGALPWGLALGAGFFFAADLAAWHLGIVRTTTANATLFANTTAFMLAGWAILVRREQPEAATVKALALAAAGTLLLLGSSAQVGAGHLLGDLLSLVAAGFYTGYLLVVMRLRGRLPTATVLAMSTFCSALLLAPAALLEPGSLWPVDWRPVVALAVSSQLIGQGLMVFASGKLPASVLALGLLVQPLVSAAAGWLIFGEALGPVELAGAAMIAAALVLVRR
jgi:drug/metabolite transporter (DMT)-like permease